MAKRNKKNRLMNLFSPPDPYNPIDNIITTGLNIVGTLGLQRLTRDLSNKLGLGGMSVEDQIRVNRSQLSLKKVEIDIARTERQEADALERAEQLKLKQGKQALLDEKVFRLYDLKIQEKELEIEKARRRLDTMVAERTELDLHISREVISGALEVTANPEGLTGSAEQQEAYKGWLDSFEAGKVAVILGKRGSGKSCLACKIAEYCCGIHHLPTYWIGLPAQSRQLLPSWIKLVDRPEKVPMNSLILCDEAGVNYLSLLFNTSQNRFMRRLLMIARQRHISLIFAGQSSRDLDWSIIRQADTLAFKELGLNQVESERPDVKAKAARAAAAFKDLPKDEKIEAAYICDGSFEGLIQSTLPTFWSEDLSHVYAHLDLTQIEGEGSDRDKLEEAIDDETRYLDDASLDKEILRLRQRGDGVERIAKTLGCSVWKVRKCLNI